MSKMIYMAVLMMFMSLTTAFAQESKRATPPPPTQRSPSEMATNRVAALSKQLKLTPDQEKSVLALYTDLFEERQKTMSTRQNALNARPSQEEMAEMRKKNNALQSETAQKVKALLDEEQAVKFERVLKEEAARSRGGGRG